MLIALHYRGYCVIAVCRRGSVLTVTPSSPFAVYYVKYNKTTKKVKEDCFVVVVKEVCLGNSNPNIINPNPSLVNYGPKNTIQ